MQSDSKQTSADAHGNNHAVARLRNRRRLSLASHLQGRGDLITTSFHALHIAHRHRLRRWGVAKLPGVIQTCRPDLTILCKRNCVKDQCCDHLLQAQLAGPRNSGT